MNISKFLSIMGCMLFGLMTYVFSHCQVPCGIYDDEIRFDILSEDITTLEKSMQQIIELSKSGDKNYNQLVRWVNNKDAHADKFTEIIKYYFLQQRIKPVDKKEKKKYKIYLNKLTLCHELLFYGMKTKQTTDLNHIEKLKSLLADFKAVYLKEQEHHHKQKH